MDGLNFCSARFQIYLCAAVRRLELILEEEEVAGKEEMEVVLEGIQLTPLVMGCLPKIFSSRYHHRIGVVTQLCIRKKVVKKVGIQDSTSSTTSSSIRTPLFLDFHLSGKRMGCLTPTDPGHQPRLTSSFSGCFSSMSLLEICRVPRNPTTTLTSSTGGIIMIFWGLHLIIASRIVSPV